MKKSEYWKPEEGEYILVAKEKYGKYFGRNFIEMAGDYFICESINSESTMEAWQFGKKKELPWIPHDGTKFPACLPTDCIEVKMSDGTTDIDLAGSYYWNHNYDDNNTIAWRLVWR